MKASQTRREVFFSLQEDYFFVRPRGCGAGRQLWGLVGTFGQGSPGQPGVKGRRVTHRPAAGSHRAVNRQGKGLLFTHTLCILSLRLISRPLLHSSTFSPPPSFSVSSSRSVQYPML